MSLGHLIFMSGICKDFRVLKMNKEKITLITKLIFDLKLLGKI